MFGLFFRFWQHRRRLSTLNAKLKAAVIFLLLLWYATSGFLYFETPAKPDLGWGDALWWAVVTMATVGYGDIFPVSPGGRYLIGVPTMVFGIGFLGYLISEIAGGLIESRSRRLKGMSDITCRKHILIINAPQLDALLRVIRELRSDASTRGREICLVDEHLESLPPEALAEGLHFVKGDPTRIEVLKRAGAQAATHALVLLKAAADPHADDQNLVTTLILERLNPDLHTVVEVGNPGKVPEVELAGADSVVCAAMITAGLLVQELQDPGVRRIIQDLTSDEGGNQIYLVDIRVAGPRVYGQVASAALEQGFSALGLMREGRELLNPSRDSVLLPGDRAILVGRTRPEELRLA